MGFPPALKKNTTISAHRLVSSCPLHSMQALPASLPWPLLFSFSLLPLNPFLPQIAYAGKRAQQHCLSGVARPLLTWTLPPPPIHSVSHRLRQHVRGPF